MTADPEYRIEIHGRRHFVVAPGERHGPYPSRKAAQSVIDALRSERQLSPAQAHAREQRAAYRMVASDPYLTALKDFLPRKGEIERNTQEAYKRSLNFVGGQMRIASSDPALHTALNRTAGQSRTAKAAESHHEQGDDTKLAVVAAWKKLAAAGIPNHKRSRLIANELRLDPAYVRRLTAKLKLHAA